MGNPQGIEFKTVNDFLDYLPEKELETVQFLRRIILDCIGPNGKEKLAYNVPFYYLHSRICYIWPASIPWGKVSNGVAVGFCKGSLMFDDTFKSSQFITKEIYNTISEIDVLELKQKIYEAVRIDQEIVNAKRNKFK